MAAKDQLKKRNELMKIECFTDLYTDSLTTQKDKNENEKQQSDINVDNLSSFIEIKEALLFKLLTPKESNKEDISSQGDKKDGAISSTYILEDRKKIGVLVGLMTCMNISTRSPEANAQGLHSRLLFCQILRKSVSKLGLSYFIHDGGLVQLRIWLVELFQKYTEINNQKASLDLEDFESIINEILSVLEILPISKSHEVPLTKSAILPFIKEKEKTKDEKISLSIKQKLKHIRGIWKERFRSTVESEVKIESLWNKDLSKYLIETYEEKSKNSNVERHSVKDEDHIKPKKESNSNSKGENRVDDVESKEKEKLRIRQEIEKEKEKILRQMQQSQKGNGKNTGDNGETRFHSRIDMESKGNLYTERNKKRVASMMGENGVDSRKKKVKKKKNDTSSVSVATVAKKISVAASKKKKGVTWKDEVENDGKEDKKKLCETFIVERLVYIDDDEDEDMDVEEEDEDIQSNNIQTKDLARKERAMEKKSLSNDRSSNSFIKGPIRHSFQISRQPQTNKSASKSGKKSTFLSNVDGFENKTPAKDYERTTRNMPSINTKTYDPFAIDDQKDDSNNFDEGVSSSIDTMEAENDDDAYVPEDMEDMPQSNNSHRNNRGRPDAEVDVDERPYIEDDDEEENANSLPWRNYGMGLLPGTQQISGFSSSENNSFQTIKETTLTSGFSTTPGTGFSDPFAPGTESPIPVSKTPLLPPSALLGALNKGPSNFQQGDGFSSFPIANGGFSNGPNNPLPPIPATVIPPPVPTSTSNFTGHAFSAQHLIDSALKRDVYNPPQTHVPPFGNVAPNPPPNFIPPRPPVPPPSQQTAPRASISSLLSMVKK